MTPTIHPTRPNPLPTQASRKGKKGPEEEERQAKELREKIGGEWRLVFTTGTKGTQVGGWVGCVCWIDGFGLIWQCWGPRETMFDV